MGTHTLGSLTPFTFILEEIQNCDPVPLHGHHQNGDDTRMCLESRYLMSGCPVIVPLPLPKYPLDGSKCL